MYQDTMWEEDTDSEDLTFTLLNLPPPEVSLQYLVEWNFSESLSSKTMWRDVFLNMHEILEQVS